MMSALLRTVLAFCLLVGAMAQLPANTTVSAMLKMIPDCAIQCVLDDVFKDGGCPPTNAGALSQCACTNTTLQSRLSACVQQSCKFVDQIEINTFAAELCEAYPKENRIDELKTISIVTIALSIPFLLLRLYSRWVKTGRLWSDDVYAITAAIFLVTVSIIILRMSLMGFGLHYWNVPPENGPALLKMFYVCQMLYVLVQIFSKVAILALYSRLFPNFIRWFQWSVRGMIAFMFIHGLVFFLLVTFQCTPIALIWDKTVEGKCIPISAAIGFLGAGLSIVEDFIILLLPVHELWKLQMNTKKKAGLVLLFSVGSFASITSVIRLKFVLKYANTYDSTWDNVDVIKWSLIEIVSACICGNLLPLRPLFEKMMPSVRSLFSWYSDWSRRSDDRSFSFRNFSWLQRTDKSSEKPNLISTLNFTQMSLSPGWDWKNSNASEAVSPTTPIPVHFEDERPNLGRPRGFSDEEMTFDRSVPPGMIRKTSTTMLSTTQTSKSKSGSDCSSVRDLMPSRPHREHRISGPWSRALSVFGKPQ